MCEGGTEHEIDRGVKKWKWSWNVKDLTNVQHEPDHLGAYYSELNCCGYKVVPLAAPLEPTKHRPEWRSWNPDGCEQSLLLELSSASFYRLTHNDGGISLKSIITSFLCSAPTKKSHSNWYNLKDWRLDDGWIQCCVRNVTITVSNIILKCACFHKHYYMFV